MFEVGKVYNRREDIHKVYKGQQYGGISTPSNYPYIFIFTGEAGQEFGYSDGFKSDGSFWYTGEGQEGPMQMTKGNLAIKNHKKNNKDILLFEYISSGFVRFVGYCTYIYHHIIQLPDRNDKQRDAIVFQLDIINTNHSNLINEPTTQKIKRPTSKKTLNELREIATSQTSEKLELKEKLQVIQYRSEAIKIYTKKRAKGYCEGCNEPAPFNTKSGPYLEVHHFTRLADGGADTPENVIALCPTCHRRVHYSTDKNTYNLTLINKAKDIEIKLQHTLDN
ncbi:HNH endonuclease [Photobacterium leiognathi]|uniref:HNH endonuclease n=1 Tax=Photobacterium leiognathi TaxID=553611 RepID=UPI0029818985|nr:HNH endonuclease signature motif containing protein [Photobacterium leiognathi]